MMTLFIWLISFFKKPVETVAMNTLKDFFKKEMALFQSTKIQGMLLNLLNEFSPATLKDITLRNAAIDAVIQLLQDEKTSTPVPTPPQSNES